MGKIPTLSQCNEMMRRKWDTGTYPKLVYVATTNYCNGHCVYCLYDQMEMPVETMSVERFERLCAKVRERPGLKIGAMFCFGEPLSDKKLFEKIKIAKQQGILTRYLGLNTNCTYLTKDIFRDILEYCGNITLSFVNIGEEFESLTGLNWMQCYINAIAFIEYRDKHKPGFQIEIGCNDVTGHNRVKVAQAFKGYRLDWARDAEVRWRNNVTTGVVDRSIMYRRWTCDGYKGAMQIKPNGDCCFCGFDVVRNETKFANIFENTWKEIEQGFKSRWKEPSALCLQCDFWWNYYQVIAGGWSRKHVDDSWQEKYSNG